MQPSAVASPLLVGGDPAPMTEIAPLPPGSLSKGMRSRHRT
jgi:hypothetical protein